MMRDEHGRPKSMFKNLRKLHGQGIEGQGLNNLSDAFQSFVTRARFFSIGHLRRTWSHSAVEFMKYRRRLPALMAGEAGSSQAHHDSDSDDDACVSVADPMIHSSLAEEGCFSEAEGSGRSFARFGGKSASFREPSAGRVGEAAGESERRRIHVSNVSYRATTSQLASFFAKFGKVATCSIPVDKAGTLPRHGGRPKSKGHAYLTFKSEDAVLAAKAARPEELRFYDRVMVVSQPLPTPRKTRGSSTSLSEYAAPDAPLATIPAEDPPSANASETSDSETSAASAKPQAGINARLSEKILGMVLGKLELSDRVRAERVCKKWLEAAMLSWVAETSIVLSERRFGVTSGGSRKPLQKAVLLAILRRAGPSLASLDFSATPHFLDASALPLVAGHCPGLKEVNLTGLKVHWQELKLFAESCPGLKALTYREAQSLGEKACWYLFRSCANLERVDLAGCRRLHGRCFKLLGIFLDSVRLEGCRGLEPEAVEEMALKSPHLSRLHLDDCARLSDQSVAIIARSMASLKVLSLCGSGMPELTSSGLAQIGLIESMEEVRLDRNPAVTDEVVESIAGGCMGLRKLSLAGAGQGESPSEVGLTAVSAAKGLEELDLSHLPGVKDSVLVLGLASLSRLETLRLRGCRNLSDKGIVGLARGCRRLLELDLSGCLRVGKTGVEAVVAGFPVDKAGGGATVSVVVGGSGFVTRSSTGTKGSRVVLDASDYSAELLPSVPGATGSGRSGAGGGPGREESDEEVDDDEFESLTASRSFVLERLEEDDLVLDQSRIAEWQAQFEKLQNQG